MATTTEPGAAAPADGVAEAPVEAPVEPGDGLIVFLNGTSSSGKSSIARALLPLLRDEPWFHMPVDAFHHMRSSGPVEGEALDTMLRRTWAGYHRAVAGMARAGNNVLVDHLFSQPWRLRDCLDLFPPEHVVLVGVRCPLPELERRERERGDRPAGLAARQIGPVHAHGIYDIEVDTSTTDAVGCARTIADYLPRRTTPTAFQRLAASHAR